jgi:hypothetical protein
LLIKFSSDPFLLTCDVGDGRIAHTKDDTSKISVPEEVRSIKLLKSLLEPADNYFATDTLATLAGASTGRVQPTGEAEARLLL